MRRSALAILLLLAGCANSGGDTVVVSAAASLTEAFTELAERFEDEHPGLDVVLNISGSQRLATQLLEGGAVDVFASANAAQMDRVADAGLLFDVRRIVATNQLVIAVEPGNPAGVAGLDDLARDDLVVVLAAPEVPVGAYARDALAGAEVDVEPASLEPDVRSVLSKVVLGEADAGIVYVSDLLAATGEVTAVEIPAELNVTAAYPIARLREAQNPSGADAFIDFATSNTGRAVMQTWGFSVP